MKFYGKVGFWEEDEEVSPGVYRPRIVEHTYMGDVQDNTRRFQPVSDSTNDEFTVTNRISILSDMYAQQNWPSIKYVEWCNTRWKVTSVNVNYPRIVITLGGVWNGVEAEPTPIFT